MYYAYPYPTITAAAGAASTAPTPDTPAVPAPAPPAAAGGGAPPPHSGKCRRLPESGSSPAAAAGGAADPAADDGQRGEGGHARWDAAALARPSKLRNDQDPNSIVCHIIHINIRFCSAQQRFWIGGFSITIRGLPHMTSALEGRG